MLFSRNPRTRPVPSRAARRNRARILMESLESRQLLSADAAIHAAANHEVSGMLCSLGDNFRVFDGRMATPNVGDSINVNVDWGDGTASTGTVVATANGFDLYGDHLYASAGAYSVGIAAYSGPPSTGDAAPAYLIMSAQGSATADITDDQAAPLVSADGSFGGKIAAVPVQAGIGRDAGYTIAPGLSGIAVNTVTIDWGDGSSSVATLVANDHGSFDVLGEHQYAAPGSYDLRLSGSATVYPSDALAADWTLINSLYFGEALTVTDVIAPVAAGSAPAADAVAAPTVQGVAQNSGSITSPAADTTPVVDATVTVPTAQNATPAATTAPVDQSVATYYQPGVGDSAVSETPDALVNGDLTLIAPII